MHYFHTINLKIKNVHSVTLALEKYFKNLKGKGGDDESMGFLKKLSVESHRPVGELINKYMSPEVIYVGSFEDCEYTAVIAADEFMSKEFACELSKLVECKTVYLKYDETGSYITVYDNGERALSLTKETHGIDTFFVDDICKKTLTHEELNAIRIFNKVDTKQLTDTHIRILGDSFKAVFTTGYAQMNDKKTRGELAFKQHDKIHAVKIRM